MTDLEIYPDTDRTPSTLFASPDPAAIVAQATRIANEIAPLIREQRLVKRIGQSDHVFLEGWTLAGTMLGVFPITVASGPIVVEGEVLGYQATVEARTMAGNMVGRADAQCTHDENEKWKHAPSFQLRSMAITRASSKALRMPLGFVMHLAGYDATPAEEMEAAAARGETVSGGKGVAGGWRDLAEQDRAHKRMREYIDAHQLHGLAATLMDSKGYRIPLSKAQMADLRRAIDRELAQMSDPASAPTPPGGGPGSDPTVPVGEQPNARAAGAPAGTPMSGEEGERVRSGNMPRERRDDPSPSDPTSSPPLQGEGSGGEDPTSAAGSSPSTAGASGEFAPAGSPAADPNVRGGGTPTRTGGQPATASAGASNVHAPDDQSPTRPVSEQPGRVGGNVQDPPIMRVAPTGPTYPVEEWAINQDPPVDLRVAKVALRKQFKEDFGWLRDWKDLQELQGEQAVNAVKALEAIYLDPGGR